jgi:hypothetical protein
MQARDPTASWLRVPHPKCNDMQAQPPAAHFGASQASPFGGVPQSGVNACPPPPYSYLLPPAPPPPTIEQSRHASTQWGSTAARAGDQPRQPQPGSTAAPAPDAAAHDRGRPAHRCRSDSLSMQVRRAPPRGLSSSCGAGAQGTMPAVPRTSCSGGSCERRRRASHASAAPRPMKRVAQESSCVMPPRR